MKGKSLSRRQFLAMAAGAGVGTLAIACAPQPPAAAPAATTKPAAPAAAAPTVAPAAAPAAAAKKELEMSIWGSWDATYGKFVQEYLPKHSDIKVNISSAPQAEYHDRLLTRMASGAVPDISMIVDFDFARFYTRNLLNDLNPFVATVKEWDQGKPGYGHFYPIIASFFKPGGKQYAIPAEVNPQPIAYNIEMFEKAGLPTPYDLWKQDKWDWVTFVDTAKKLTKGEGDNKVFGMAVGAMKIWAFAQEIWANGSDVFNDDRSKFRLLEPEAVEVIQAYADLYIKHKVTPAHIRSADGAPGAFFPKGRAAMIHGSTWLRPTMKDSPVKWGFAPQPKWKAYGCWTGGFSYTIPKGAKYPDASWEVIKNMASVEGATWLLKNGHAGSSVIKAMNSDGFLYEPPKNAEVALWMLDYAKPQPFIKENYKFMEIFDREMDLCATGSKTAQQACDAIVKEATPLLTA